MKLFVLKLLSLFVMLAGIAGLAHHFAGCETTCPVAAAGVTMAAQYQALKASLPEIAGLNLLVWAIYLAAILLGLYGFLPRFGGGGKKIVFAGEYGAITIALKPVEASLHRVLRRMPEIAKFTARVRPAEQGKKVRIDATVTLHAQPAARARKTVALVHQYIAETAMRMLALEDLSTITLKVNDIQVDAKRSSQLLHEELLNREIEEKQQAEMAAVVAATTPVSAPVTDLPAVEAPLPYVAAPVTAPEPAPISTAFVPEEETAIPEVEPIILSAADDDDAETLPPLSDLPAVEEEKKPNEENPWA